MKNSQRKQKLKNKEREKRYVQNFKKSSKRRWIFKEKSHVILTSNQSVACLTDSRSRFTELGYIESIDPLGLSEFDESPFKV
jgi:hypothetical protein